MKNIVFIIMFFLSFFFIDVKASANTYTDDMSSVENSSIKKYNNLTPIANTNIPPSVKFGIEGQRALSFASNNYLGFVEYNVYGAQTIDVEIYTAKGTYISIAPSQPLYVWGNFQENMSHISQQQLTQAQYSRSDGGVFARIDGKVNKAVQIFPYYTFVESESQVSDLVDYGLNVYATNSYASTSRVALNMNSSQRTKSIENNSNYVREVLTYTLPQNTTKVKIEINDFSYLWVKSDDNRYERRLPPTGMRTILSSVSFSGSDLRLGSAEAVQSNSLHINSSSLNSSSNSSMSLISGSLNSSSSSKSSSSKVAKSKSSSSKDEEVKSEKSKSESKEYIKFEGVITSTNPAEKVKNSKKSSSSSESSEKSINEESNNKSIAEQQNGVQIFRIEPSQNQVNSNGIIGYIVVVSCITVILLIRGRI